MRQGPVPHDQRRYRENREGMQGLKVQRKEASLIQINDPLATSAHVTTGIYQHISLRWRISPMGHVNQPKVLGKHYINHKLIKIRRLQLIG